MADWNLPSLPSTYALFLQYLKERDEDLAKAFNSLPTNPLANMLRFERTGYKFQEYSGGSWTDRQLGIGGGGTGAATAANARTNLGLGTIATQDANNVNITGGSIAGVTIGGTISGTHTGDGSGLTDLNASEITSGTLAAARLPTLPIANFPTSGNWPALTGAINIGGSYPVKIDSLSLKRRSPGAGSIAVDFGDSTILVQGGPSTLNLPAAATYDGKIYLFKKDYAGSTLTIDPNGAELIDGASNLVITADYGAVIIQSDGGGWKILGSYNLVAAPVVSVQQVDIVYTNNISQNYALGTALANYLKASVSFVGNSVLSIKLINNTQIQVVNPLASTVSVRGTAYITEYNF